MRTEQNVLRLSFVGILIFAVVAIVFGLIAGSSAILFDGVFSGVDALMSLASIWVAGLVARSASNTFSERTRRRFGWGFWHLEPILLAVNAVLMMSIAGYAAVQSVQSILDGGREVEFGPAMIYAVIILALTITLTIVEYRANRHIGSALIAMDVKWWIMSGGITAALLIAFAIGSVLDGTDAEWFAPYVDPTVLLIVAIVLVPVPIGILRSALADLLMVTPQDLQREAEEHAHRLVEENGFDAAEVYTAKMGRSREVQIFIRVPRGAEPRALEEWDDLRAPIVEALRGDDPNRFVTVTFSTR